MTKSIIRVAPGAIDITGIALEYVSNSDDTEAFQCFTQVLSGMLSFDMK